MSYLDLFAQIREILAISFKIVKDEIEGDSTRDEVCVEIIGFFFAQNREILPISYQIVDMRFDVLPGCVLLSYFMTISNIPTIYVQRLFLALWNYVLRPKDDQISHTHTHARTYTYDAHEH